MSKIKDAADTAWAAVRTGKFWKELIIMTVGMAIAALAVNYFLVPGKLIVGSISGLSIVISGIFDIFGMTVKVSTVIVIINAILLILAYLLIDREFGIKTVYTALILGPLMDLWEKVLPASELITDGTSVMGDIWLDLCCFVLLLSASQAILFHINASTGGLDISRRGVVPKFSDLEVISLSMTSESLGIDSEAYLFSILKGYKEEFPNLISRRQYNDRRKFTRNLCETIRKRMADSIDGGEDYFCIDSKPIEVCRVARGKRCTMGKTDYSKAPSFGYCASQKTHYYGYKLHVLCGLSGVIHSYDLTKASVHDINYLQDIKLAYHDCSIFGDRGYIGKEIQLDLFESANIKLECPYRLNQKDWKPQFLPFAKARKRVETDFSQLCDQFMIIRNYAKDTIGLFTRIIGKISAFTILQYVNKLNNRPIGEIKYAMN